MLNRRTLRAKAMQTAFAYRQCKEANYANALENIRQNFLPDLNSMEPQDPKELATQGKEAQTLFEKYVFSDYEDIKEGSNDKINKSAFTEIRDYHSTNQKDRRFLKSQMVQASEKVYHYYILNLLALIQLSKIADQDKKFNQENFAKNKILQLLENNQELKDVAVRNELNWKNEEGLLRQWHRDFIKTDEVYLNYNKQENVNFDDDKEILLHLIKKVFFDKEVIESHWQEQDLQWTEDRTVVLSMLKKTIKDAEEGSNTVELQVLSYNWEEDKDFFKDLYDAALEVAEKYQDTIAQKTSNWDIERLATTDRIIIEMAIAEMIKFPSIPVKVTINEYIEISKRYSTPKSKQFINGMLDVISKDLIDKGIIKKSGRGLIDNK